MWNERKREIAKFFPELLQNCIVLSNKSGNGFSKKGSRHGKLEWPLDDEDDDIAREIANVPKITLSRPAAKKSSPQTQKQPVLWKQQQKVRQPQKTHQPQGEKYGNGAPSPFKRIIPDNRSQRGGVAWPPSKKEVE